MLDTRPDKIRNYTLPPVSQTGAFSFPFPELVEGVVKSNFSHLLLIKKEVQFRGLMQHMEIAPCGGAAQHVSMVPHKMALLLITMTFYSPGRDLSELALPISGALLSRIAEVAPIPSSVARCGLASSEGAHKWKLRDGSMWCYFPVGVQLSPQGPYRTAVTMKEDWLPHGKLLLTFDVEPDPRDPVRLRALKPLLQRESQIFHRAGRET
jgi:hypothetical protein